ncbi:hypothetical protein PAAG_11084 [Paracoccidioides lutzii Pb01]|uniref:Uncharacterized protein n=1 Tax=Paracoccidioides lutzii (strain ATCC MYA-826 / Pb01) TaxID=502779 RepID=A0A0A2V3T2_PARBA|nr:hypothetical protein PAAG_11084 [Paracoccidioides lutzii Pb01]KGQ02133.1 hypothetical protein PAAG_11084 [Paracoccidioides lutzii Pb01]
MSFRPPLLSAPSCQKRWTMGHLWVTPGQTPAKLSPTTREWLAHTLAATNGKSRKRPYGLDEQLPKGFRFRNFIPAPKSFEKPDCGLTFQKVWSARYKPPK